MVLTFTTPSLARLNKKSIPPILLVVLAAIILFHQRNSVSGLVLLPFQTSRPLETNPVQYSWEREANIAETNAPTTDPSYPIFKSVSRGNLIPNRILRTWKTSSVEEIKQMSLNGSDHPERIVWFENWSKMNPRAIQVVLSDADMDPFVRGAFTKRVVDAFFNLPRMILRADFLRYMMLSLHGHGYELQYSNI
ncbi:hypothetical protein BDR26DRAFT_617862 [Obelidium mucronatum]|nr:hypothetical protein BDR26DRAFT_617862 [Obelidium mucronatum]